MNQKNYFLKEISKEEKGKKYSKLWIEKENIMILLMELMKEGLRMINWINNDYRFFKKYLDLQRINVLTYLYYLAKFFLSNLIKIKWIKN